MKVRAVPKDESFILHQKIIPFVRTDVKVFKPRIKGGVQLVKH